MKFHRISPCPRCGGKVRVHVLVPFCDKELWFRCRSCNQGALMALCLKATWGFYPNWDDAVKQAIRRWNAMCNGDKRFALIYESLGGRR